MKKLILALLLLAGCTAPLDKYEESKSVMNTTFTITVYDTDAQRAQAGIESAFKEMGRIESLLSHTLKTSEVYRLNAEGEIESFSDDLYYNMEKAIYYSNLSDGSFDITIQPILDLYTKTFSEEKRPPTKEEVNEELKKVGYKNIEFSRDKIKLQPGTKITLGGIAKGYAVEKASEVLRKDGIEHALINAKSSIMAVGNKGDDDWAIALQNPRDAIEYISILKLNGNAISTSGDYERFFDDSKKYHHIVNPKTGYSAEELISVTIIADSAFDADALSTAVFVLGKEKGMELIEKLPSVERLIITGDKKIIKSSGFQ